MNRERLDSLCRQSMMVVIGLLMGVAILGWGGENPTVRGIIELLGGLLGLLLAGRLALGIKARFLWPPVCWAVLGIMGYAALRYGWLLRREGVEYLARAELTQIWVAGLVFFAVIHHLYHQEHATVLMATVVLLGLMSVTVGIWQFFNAGETVLGVVKPAQYGGRVSGTFLSPNELGALISIVLPIAMAGLLMGDIRPVQRVCLGYASWMLAAGLALSLSRGAWIGTLLALTILLAVVLRDHRRRVSALIVAGIGIFAAGAFMAKHRMVAHRISDILPRADYRDPRLLTWPAVWKMIRERPTIGWGPAQFAVRFPAYRPESLAAEPSPSSARNDYLETLVDYGVPGFVLLVAAAGFLLGESLVRRRHLYSASDDLEERPSNRATLALGTGLGLTALLVHCFFESNLRTPAIAIVSAVVGGVLAGHLRYTTESHWRGFARGGRWLAVVVLLIAAAALTTSSVRRLRETTALAEANQLGSTSVAGLTALGRAAALEPLNPETPRRLGDALRTEANNTAASGEQLRKGAIDWYLRSLSVNRFDPLVHIRIGETWHRLGQGKANGIWFTNALLLDPNDPFTRAQLGWHHFDLGNLSQARHWFEESLRLKPSDNPLAASYLALIRSRTAPQGSP